MSVLGTVVGVLVAIISLIGIGLLAFVVLVLKDAASKEAAAIIPACTRNLIDRAKCQLPDGERERWEEEWLAGFEKAIEERPVWALFQAISNLRGARQIARQLQPAPASPSNRWAGLTGVAAGTAKLGDWLGERSSRLRDLITRSLRLVFPDTTRIHRLATVTAVLTVPVSILGFLGTMHITSTIYIAPAVAFAGVATGIFLVLQSRR
jgi:hypothetical protein